MKPNDYLEYSTVFDYFSQPDLFPVLSEFVTTYIVPHIREHSKVVDVGAGTGLFSLMLLEHVPSLQLTLVEPSKEMMAIAKKRLGHRVRYCEETIDTALVSLPMQNAFIFQRSLYVIYENQRHCQKLFDALHQKLHAHGRVFIQDISEKYNIDEYRSLIFNQYQLTTTEEELIKKYVIFEKILKEFNRQVDAGNFHLFTDDELLQLMRASGFQPFIPACDGMYIFERD